MELPAVLSPWSHGWCYVLLLAKCAVGTEYCQGGELTELLVSSVFTWGSILYSQLADLASPGGPANTSSHQFFQGTPKLSP